MIHERWRAVAQANDDLAVVVDDLEVSYRELLDLEAAFARVLRERHGIAAGDVLLAPLSTGLEPIVALLASARLGAVLAPLSPDLRDPELAHYLDRLDLAGVVTTASLLSRWPSLRKRAEGRLVLVDPHRLESRTGDHRRVGGPFEGELVYLSTSGSTGRPKIVARSHAAQIASLEGVADELAIGPGDRVLGAVPLHHGYGISKGLLLSLLSGATLILMPRFLPRRAIEIVARRRATAIVGSPLIFSSLAECVDDPADLASVRLCLSSGAALPEGVRRGFEGATGLRVRELYGSSEASAIALQEADGRLPGYRPVHRVDLRIRGRNGETLPPGQVGDVTLRSPALALGYVVDRDRNLASFGDGYWPTGDLGSLDDHGLLVLAGRRREHLNVSGIKVDPVELETVLCDLGGVVGAHVVAIEGPRGLDVIKATVLASPGAALTREGVVAHCRSRLAEYKLPRLIEITETA